LRTSRTTPPSPPPMTRTFFGFGWLANGRCAIISWYLYAWLANSGSSGRWRGTHENSSRSVHWITPSSTRTLPYVSDSKTRTSWKRDFSTCRIFWTLSVIAWPGHWEEISRNQPSAGMGQFLPSGMGMCLPWMEGWVRVGMVVVEGGGMGWQNFMTRSIIRLI